MKSELDSLMKASDLDAILVVGNAGYNPPMTYMIGGGHVNQAVVIKKRNEAALLFCHVMERDEARRSGFKMTPLPLPPVEIFCGKEGLRLFEEVGLTSGRVGLFGRVDLAAGLMLIQNISQGFPAIEFVAMAGDDNIFHRAMETKDHDEVDRIRKMGRITVDVVRQTAEFLTSREVREDEVLLKEDGSPLTVGDMHTMIRLWVAQHGAELPAGFIFSIGRDAGVPHSTGAPEDLIRLGKTIIFDIYPAEAGGGFFYDFTRTWSLGYASTESQELYDQVFEIFNRLLENFDLNTAFKTYETMVCDYFELKNHPTKRTTPPAPLMGYVHSLGHGVGLNIHERPQSAFNRSDDNILKPGVVFTSEPGLYYPEKGMGVRIEDTLWMNPDGNAEILADYPYDFVLTMEKWKHK